VPLQQGSIDEIWSQVPLFQCLPKELHPHLTACSQQVEYEAGQMIIRQHDVGDAFYVIKEGTADVLIGEVVQAQIRTGDYFGEEALLQPEPRSASIKATSKLRAVKIMRSEFQRLGLHEKLGFPKRDKMTKRHKMMAAGTAGVGKDTKQPGAGLEVAVKKRLSTLGPPPVQKPFCRVQLDCLKDIFTDKINITAFVFVPLGQYIKYAEYGPGLVFFSNFAAIIPLASILGQATEALATHTGQLIGGLLNATFGNAVEMIMCIQAVKAGLIQVVQGNLLGSILSNLLLVLGMAIFASGVARKTQKFNKMGASSNMSCQLTASISVCLPTCFAVVQNSAGGAVLMISRICSVGLVMVYGMFLFFMLKTHADLFEDEAGGEEEDTEDVLSPSFSIGLLLLSTLVVFFASECLVDSIEGVSEDYGLSKTFIGVILLPIVGNAAEHATAVTCAYKGMMDFALGVAVGSSTQIALFVVPCAILCGYIYDQPMDLDFSVFDTTCQMLTVFLVSQVLSHGETNWLHGAMLVTVYLFIATQTLYIAEDKGA